MRRRPHSVRARLDRLEGRSVPAVFVVTTSADSGPGSLRQAILDANAMPGADSIVFRIQIPPNELATIAPSTPLPSLTDPVDIDGTTEPGYSGSPRVALDGSFARGPGGSPASGLTLGADGCGVFGLDIEGFRKDGISVQSSGNTISANAIGNNGGDGVRVWDDATLNVVGFSGNGGGNSIFKNGGDGVDLYDPGTVNNSVDDNTIVNNRVDGVNISGGASFNTVGGPPVQSGNFARSNLISGNGRFGVVIAGPATTGNVLKSNWIGLDSDGRTALPNAALQPTTAANVAVLDSPGNWIGSTDPGMQNVISGCKNNGIEISGLFATGNIVEGNWIGTDATGTAAVGNHIGLAIRNGASDTVVGGNVPAARNVIAGNSRAGILVSSSPKVAYQTTGNQVLGNWLGLGVNGLKLGTQFYGVYLAAPANRVGGPGAGGNVISGNATVGIAVAGPAARGNLIQGNLIGTDPAGREAAGNGFAATSFVPGAGVLLWPGAVDNRIGGPDAGDGNVISGNVGDGIEISGADGFTSGLPTGNVVQGNFIGTDSGGTQAVANTHNGVQLALGATGNLIGGPEPGARNLISGNGGIGVSVHDHLTTQNLVQGNWVGLDANGNALGNTGVGVGIGFAGPANDIGGAAAGAGNVISANGGGGVALVATTATAVQGNRIGTDPTGSLPRGNHGNGLVISAARLNVVGGTVTGTGNLVSANAGDGILISGLAAFNDLFGNDVGTDGTGQPAAGMGNGANGIEIKGGAFNYLGDPGVGAGNRIAGNAGVGVVMLAGSRNPVREDSIFANRGGGIRLVPTGAEVATPVLGSVTLDANNHPVVQGTFQGAPNTTYYLEFFASSTADPTGNGSGELFLNSRPLRVVTDARGHASFAVEIPGLVGPFTYVLSATATDSLLNNTSGFSNYVQL